MDGRFVCTRPNAVRYTLKPNGVQYRLTLYVPYAYIREGREYYLPVPSRNDLTHIRAHIK